jgi:hypothetical protein
MKKYLAALCLLFCLALPAQADGISSGQCVGCTEGINNPVAIAGSFTPACTAWTATCSASVASVEITALFVKNI